MKFEVFKSEKNQKFYFRLKANNGKIVLASQAYASKAACLNGVKSVRNNGSKNSSFESKLTPNGKLYFVLLASNKQVIGTSQHYKSKSGCVNGINSIIKGVSEAKIMEV